jgi:hypothetical protein
MTDCNHPEIDIAPFAEFIVDWRGAGIAVRLAPIRCPYCGMIAVFDRAATIDAIRDSDPDDPPVLVFRYAKRPRLNTVTRSTAAPDGLPLLDRVY